MTRHPLRWDSLVFGLFFAAIVANWAVWRQDLLTTRQLSLTTSGVLIVLGVVGVAATIWRARPKPADIPESSEEPTDPEGPENEEAQPQP